ncbi:MAG: dipicolinate synthase subunit B [Clostridiaceae bacterium]|nr:dipicolinate synthase subunit B [Clostridiaceae bacterium]
MLKNLKVGVAMTGSFCTIPQVLPVVEDLVKEGCDVYPILSEIVSVTNTRFIQADELIRTLEILTDKKVITSIKEAEPIGPNKLLDILAVIPCTGNTLAKLANGITDSSVTMAVKAHLRNDRPVVLGPSTNDGLGANLKNIGLLMNMKNIYFIPFNKDAPHSKKNSLIANFELLKPVMESALEKKQYQPVLM